MTQEPKNHLSLIQDALSKGGHEKILQFLLNTLGGTPYIGGVFGGIASVWSDSKQEILNHLILESLKIIDEKVEIVKKALVSSQDKNQTVAGFISLNPNSVEIIDSSGISSITDKGVLDLSINYSEPLDGYVFNCYGGGPVLLESASQQKSHLNIKFKRPCPDLVTLVFMKT
ncbi:MAG: hypothetical protein PF482_01750 [Desulfobacteraceae bacterium]|jgi:hypothetical protein|nr:hypothetical protein [Desulfobacteraceae bacterium]